MKILKKLKLKSSFFENKKLTNKNNLTQSSFPVFVCEEEG